MNGLRIKVFIGVTAVCAMVFSPGCEKVETDITYNIAPYLDLRDVDSLIPYARYVKVFAHQKDTVNWWVSSWEDAAQGKVKLRPGGKGNAADSSNYLVEGYLNGDVITIGPFTRGPVMLVIYDPEGHGKYESKMYGWRQIAIEPGLDRVRMAMAFAPEGFSRGKFDKDRSGDTVSLVIYDSYRWFMANDKPWDYRDDPKGDGDDDDEGVGNGQ